MRSSVNPSRRGTAALATLASSQWISTRSTPSRAKAARRQGRRPRRHEPAPAGIRASPVADLQAVLTDAAVQAGAANHGAVGVVDRDVPEVVAGVPLGDRALQELARLLSRLVGPWHPRPQVVAAQLDRLVDRVEVVDADGAAAGRRPSAARSPPAAHRARPHRDSSGPCSSTPNRPSGSRAGRRTTGRACCASRSRGTHGGPRRPLRTPASRAGRRRW